ncbi:3D domain-containing protein [Marivirga sp.]|uniref:3D domain-containing protein n=1 Tax=Marivirga sp. TaxID=2018662 RepID=UPI003DA710A2
MKYLQKININLSLFLTISISMLLLFSGCTEKRQASESDVTMEVTATAYNSVESQTKKGDPTLAAWGDRLKPGMKAIAVSRDLIKMGLDHNKKVEIEGLEGVYVVKDKMNKRWEKKIDIYMGLDEEAAINWGKKKVTITFNPEEEVEN